ncbi:MAG: RpiB/LacA/LacB family sugar-phosphate isomerase [Candidatus Peregrinibacteria bacterium]
MKTIFIGTDHAGFDHKEAIKKSLLDAGYTVEDKGAFKNDAEDDYPDFIYPVAKAVSEDLENRVGIVLGGSGQGEAMVANKVKGIRAAIGFSEWAVRMSREHNDANVLSLGARVVSPIEAVRFVHLWLNTPFEGKNRHQRRIDKIKNIENKVFQ